MSKRTFQPYTSDQTPDGRKVARNATRLWLWTADEIYAVHRWLCHPGEDCQDGCDRAAIPERMELYESEIEPC